MKLMDAKVYFKDKFEQANSVSGMLGSFQQKNWDAFTKLGLPAIKHEEWKYTKIKNLFRDDLVYTVDNSAINSLDLEGISLPGTEKSNKIVFLNGIFQQALSKINDNMLVVESLEVASNNENKSFVESHLGCSQPYHQDGINALNDGAAASAEAVAMLGHTCNCMKHMPTDPMWAALDGYHQG